MSKTQITEFSSEVIKKLAYYVYRLIDPRNGETFYVGKGKGNRVFHHVKGVLDEIFGLYVQVCYTTKNMDSKTLSALNSDNEKAGCLKNEWK